MSDTSGTSFQVPDELDGERADRILALLAGVGRAAARSALETEMVVGAEGPLKPADRLSSGDQLRGELVPTPTLPPPSSEVPITTIYEDDDLLVVDKPAGLVVHPGAGHFDDTLVSGLIHRYEEVRELGPEHRWGVIHRLDRDTSGALLVARTVKAQQKLQTDLRLRRVSRMYIALVPGAFDAATGTIDAPIGRDPRRPTRMAVRSGGRPARTHYRRRAAWDRPVVTLLEVSLETGRTHQIRVHLASIGHPVIGDATYGRRRPDVPDPGRPWLHAMRLGFEHPETGETIDVSSPLPADLEATLNALGPAILGTAGL